MSLFFTIEVCDRIYQKPLCSYYWKYLVGSGILDTCCEWYSLCGHYLLEFYERLSWYTGLVQAN